MSCQSLNADGTLLVTLHGVKTASVQNGPSAAFELPKDAFVTCHTHRKAGELCDCGGLQQCHLHTDKTQADKNNKQAPITQTQQNIQRKWLVHVFLDVFYVVKVVYSDWLCVQTDLKSQYFSDKISL